MGGTELGSMQLCDISDPLTGAYAMRKRRGATADLVTMYEWPPYTPGLALPVALSSKIAVLLAR